MCVRGRWRDLCYSSWDYQEAFVVCRQLGLPATGECVHDTCAYKAFSAMTIKHIILIAAAQGKICVNT